LPSRYFCNSTAELDRPTVTTTITVHNYVAWTFTCEWRCEWDVLRECLFGFQSFECCVYGDGYL